jgi:hypothetical protein
MYTRYFKEQESDVNESPFDHKITKLLKVLRDQSFGSEEQRKKLIDILTSMHNSSDPRARKAFKRIGDLFTEIGDELINLAKENEED